MRKELLVGCGQRLEKQLQAEGRELWEGRVTLDINPDHKPDVLWDLMQFPYPFEEGTFDEIHAYEVLEHTGAQGDYKFFFKQWSEFWRILKPNGLFLGTVPQVGTVWALGDPSHTRVIQAENFVFLDQERYKGGVGKTAMSDFRYLYKADFMIGAVSNGEGSMRFALQAVKPSRIDDDPSVDA